MGLAGGKACQRPRRKSTAFGRGVADDGTTAGGGMASGGGAGPRRFFGDMAPYTKWNRVRSGPENAACVCEVANTMSNQELRNVIREIDPH